MKFLIALIAAVVGCACPIAGSDSGTSSTTTTTSTSTTGSAPAGPYDLVGFIVTGQSLAIGEGAVAPVSTAQPFQNLKLFDASPRPGYDGDGDDLSLVPLIAPLRPLPPSGVYTYEFPDNINSETPGEGLANQLAASAGWRVVITNVGETTHGMSYIQKGGTGKAYAASLYEVGAIKALAAAQGLSYGVVGIVLVHGETDWNDPAYAGSVAQLLADYDVDVKAITGQVEDLVMLVSPQTSHYVTGTSYATLAPLQLAEQDPRFIHAGPKYQFAYVADGIHLPAPSYRRLGEQAALTLLAQREGRPAALRPLSATVAGSTVTIAFEVPSPPLAWSTALPAAHPGTPEWSAGRGFEVLDAAGMVTIESVSILGDAVVIECATPPGAGAVVSYGMHQDAEGYHGGQVEGRRGELCDSREVATYSQRVIPCWVTSGSVEIVAVSPGDVWDRGRLEMVRGDGLADAHVESIAGDTITLSAPWQAPSGQAALVFAHDHRNYAVQFTRTLEPCVCDCPHGPPTPPQIDRFCSAAPEGAVCCRTFDGTETGVCHNAECWPQ